MFAWLSRWFLNAVREGTMMGTYCGTCGSGTQELAGMLVGFGRTRDRPRSLQVVIEYLDEEAGRYAARAAVRLCQSLLIQAVIPNRI